MIEIKTVPYVPLSHPFVERLIGTVRREYLDRTLFWTTVDLERKLIDFQHYYNRRRTHAGNSLLEIAAQSSCWFIAAAAQDAGNWIPPLRVISAIFGALLMSGWACPSGSQTNRLGHCQLTGGHAWLNRERDYRCADSRGVTRHYSDS